MTNWGGILATVAGGGMAGAGEGWAKDIKSKNQDARETRRQKAIEARQINLERLRHFNNTETGVLNENMALTRDSQREKFELSKQGAEQTFRAGESKLERENRKDIAGMRSSDESVTEKKYRNEQSLKTLSMELSNIGVNLKEDDSGGLIITIPTSKDGKILDPSVFKHLDKAGVEYGAYKSGSQKPEKVENNWGWNNDVWAVTIPLGGFRQSSGKGEGIMAGGGKDILYEGKQSPNRGNVDNTKLFASADKALGKTKEAAPETYSGTNTDDIAASEIGDTVPAESGGVSGTWDDTAKDKPLLASTKDVPYDVKMGEGPTKAQVEAANRELIILAKKLGLESTIDLENVTPGSEEFDMVVSAAKKAGGTIWDQIKQLAKILGQSQAEARKGLTAYK